MQNKFKLRDRTNKFTFMFKSYSGVHLGFLCVNFYMKCLGIYPLPSTVSKFWTRVYNLLWCFYLSNHLLIIFPTFYAFGSTTQDIAVATFSLMEGLCMIECIVLLIHFKYQRSDFKILLSLVHHELNKKKRIITLDNGNVYIIAFVLIAIMYVLIIFNYIQRPETVRYHKLLTTARYPFSTRAATIKIILSCHQIVVLLHMTIILTSDGLAVLLTLICTVRLKNLETKISNEKRGKLPKRIREHQQILLQVEETNLIVRIIVIKTVFCFMVFSISTGLQIFHKFEIIQIFIVMIVFLRFYVSAESADNMATCANNLGIAVYSTAWYEEKTKIRIAKTIIIQRCQKSPRIFITGFMSELNRKYFLVVAYATYSYFTMIRTLISKNK
ncbi:odorant receptor 53 [Nasonia vitripennis]|uniref:Odorant receptor n=1 Tax=Nasonia vitripennis TaxID=7425 RepID=A0A7M6W8I2_NASVI|nr:odorant receptor 53 [Nasonia vitripennis]